MKQTAKVVVAMYVSVKKLADSRYFTNTSATTKASRAVLALSAHISIGTHLNSLGSFGISNIYYL